jgi:hypothetical protein
VAVGPGLCHSSRRIHVWNSYRIFAAADDGRDAVVVMLSSWVWVVNAKSPNAARPGVHQLRVAARRALVAAGYIPPRLGWTDAPEAKISVGLTYSSTRCSTAATPDPPDAAQIRRLSTRPCRTPCSHRQSRV